MQVINAINPLYRLKSSLIFALCTWCLFTSHPTKAQSDSVPVQSLQIDVVNAGIAYERKLSHHLAVRGAVSAGWNIWKDNFRPVPKYGFLFNPEINLALRYFPFGIKKEKISGAYIAGILNLGTNRYFSTDPRFLADYPQYPITQFAHAGIGYQHHFWKYFYVNACLSYGASINGYSRKTIHSYRVDLNFGLNLRIR